MLIIRNNTNSIIAIRLENFEGIDPKEIVLTLKPEQSGDLGDMDEGVVIVIQE